MDEELRATLSVRLNDALTELMTLQNRLPPIEEDDVNANGACERAMSNVRYALRLIGDTP